VGRTRGQDHAALLEPQAGENRPTAFGATYPVQVFSNRRDELFFFQPNPGPPHIASVANPRRPLMQVLVKSRHPNATDLRQQAERRVRFVLRRMVWMVPRAEVQMSDVMQMSDVNGPRGGADKRCQVELRTDGAGSVVVSSVANDWRTALDNALARAARFLLRLWQRSTDSRRLRQRLIHRER